CPGFRAATARRSCSPTWGRPDSLPRWRGRVRVGAWLGKRLLVEGRVQVDGNRMAKRLRGVATSLGMSHQLADIRGSGGTDDRELDHHLLEIGRRVVDVVLLGVLKGGADVSRR